jgi:hypothetical protein
MVLASAFHPPTLSRDPRAQLLSEDLSDSPTTANESGNAEIYVQSFPVAGGKWQISSAGGTDPSWRADGKELFYRSADQKLMAVEIQAGESFKAGIPRPLFAARVRTGTARNKYVAAADGERFLLVAPLGREALIPTTVVLNWHAGLGR